jgi:hypothetical protein
MDAMDPSTRQDRRLALLVLLVMACHTVAKARLGTLPELLWGCNVASFLIALGLWTARPRLVGAAFLWHLAVGEPAYVLGAVQAGHTGWTSVAAHTVPAIAAALSLRRTGLPRSAPFLALAMFLALVPVSHGLTPPALNINMAHQRLDFLRRAFPGQWDYRLAFSAGMLALLLLGDLLSARILGRPAGRPAPSPSAG